MFTIQQYDISRNDMAAAASAQRSTNPLTAIRVWAAAILKSVIYISLKLICIAHSSGFLFFSFSLSLSLYIYIYMRGVGVRVY